MSTSFGLQSQLAFQRILVKRWHPEIALVIPPMSCSQRGQSPVLLLRCELPVMLLRHKLPVVLLNAPLPVILLLSKHPVLLLSEETPIVRARVTAGALPSKQEFVREAFKKKVTNVGSEAK